MPDHPRAYEHGAMTYAYVKAENDIQAGVFDGLRGIRSDCLIKVVTIKAGELYMLHIVGHMQIVIDWFLEKGKAPYPNGSCMFYRTD